MATGIFTFPQEAPGISQEPRRSTTAVLRALNQCGSGWATAPPLQSLHCVVSSPWPGSASLCSAFLSQADSSVYLWLPLHQILTSQPISGQSPTAFEAGDGIMGTDSTRAAGAGDGVSLTRVCAEVRRGQTKLGQSKGIEFT